MPSHNFNAIVQSIVEASAPIADLAMWPAVFGRAPTAEEVQERQGWTIDALLAIVEILKR